MIEQLCPHGEVDGCPKCSILNMAKPARTPVEPCFVGLDMSLTATGFCRKQGSSITIDTIKTTPKTCDNDLARLRFIVDAMMKRIPKAVRMICIEDYFTPANRGQIGSALKLVALGTAMRLALYEAGYAFYVVAPSQLKKFATGKGSGQKSIVVREVYKKWGIDCKDDNQADACVLAHMAETIACHLDPDISLVTNTELPKYQLEVAAKVAAERPHYNCGAKMEG